MILDKIRSEIFEILLSILTDSFLLTKKMNGYTQINHITHNKKTTINFNILIFQSDIPFRTTNSLLHPNSFEFHLIDLP